MPVKRKAWQLRLGDQLAGDDDGQPGHDYINYSFCTLVCCFVNERPHKKIETD